MKKIPKILRVNIVGSVGIDEFGAKYQKGYPIPYVKGIVLAHIHGLKGSCFIPGIVRIPKDFEQKSKKMDIVRKAKNKIFTLLFSEEGIITNCIVVIAHMIIILGIPFWYLVLATWSLLQIGLINQDIYAVTFTINSFYNSSSYDFWYNSLSNKLIFIIVLWLCGWFFIVGLTELLCHYATGARDTGKFIVMRSWPRKITTTLFNLCVLIFMILYGASISMILVWWILGAILNPQKFLPAAIGSAVFIAFSVLIFSKISKIKKALNDAVSKWIDSCISSTFISNYEKEKEKLASLIAKPVEIEAQKVFNQAINSFMKLNNLPSLEKEVTDGILEGDAGAMAMLFHTNLGVEKSISIGLVGMLVQDNMIIMNSIYELSEVYKFNWDFNIRLAEIAFNEYNPDSQGINKVHSSVILSVKSLLTIVYPRFPSNTLDGILQVSLESDPQPMEKIANKLKIPSELFEVI